jgi:hypothetical protein
MADERIIAEYLVETPLALETAAESMAGEQSTGTFTRVPGETEALRERFAARVESVEALEGCETPSLAGSAKPQVAANANPIDGQRAYGYLKQICALGSRTSGTNESCSSLITIRDRSPTVTPIRRRPAAARLSERTTAGAVPRY